MRVELVGDKSALKDVLVVHDENAVVVRVEVVDDKNALEGVWRARDENAVVVRVVAECVMFVQSNVQEGY